MGPAGPYAFMLGTGRCGSSLLHEVLARHADVGFVSNIDDRLPGGHRTARWNGPVYRRLPPIASQKGRLRLAPSEAYNLLDRDVSPIISTPFRDLVAADATPWLVDRLRAAFETRRQAQGAPLLLHKFTGWPRAGLLDAVFPDARFVNVVRDGRAVALSWLQMPWWQGYQGPDHWQFGPLPPPYAHEWERSGRSFVVLAGACWKLLMDAFEDAQRLLPQDRWLQVRYEDFLADPRAQFATLLEFCGLGWTPAFERGFRRYQFRTNRAESFRTELDPANLRLLEHTLASHLERYGYG